MNHTTVQCLALCVININTHIILQTEEKHKINVKYAIKHVSIKDVIKNTKLTSKK